jgi:hypothetical protein
MTYALTPYVALVKTFEIMGDDAGGSDDGGRITTKTYPTTG